MLQVTELQAKYRDEGGVSPPEALGGAGCFPGLTDSHCKTSLAILVLQFRRRGIFGTLAANCSRYTEENLIVNKKFVGKSVEAPILG